MISYSAVIYGEVDSIPVWLAIFQDESVTEFIRQKTVESEKRIKQLKSEADEVALRRRVATAMHPNSRIISDR